MEIQWMEQFHIRKRAEPGIKIQLYCRFCPGIQFRIYIIAGIKKRIFRLDSFPDDDSEGFEFVPVTQIEVKAVIPAVGIIKSSL
jgi:hypothetical protein